MATQEDTRRRGFARVLAALVPGRGAIIIGLVAP
jgi:hypothetical protein